MENKEEFIAWVRGKRNVTISQEGGYLIPQKVKRAKKGFIAWLWRLFKSERGFEYVNLQKEFIAKAHLTKYAPDVASASSAEPLSGLESVPAVESDTQPRG